MTGYLSSGAYDYRQAVNTALSGRDMARICRASGRYDLSERWTQYGIKAIGRAREAKAQAIKNGWKFDD